MKSYAHEIVRQLLELQYLERLAEFQRSHEKSADVQARIESLRSNLLVTVLINHDRMRERGKASVAEVRNGVCSACHLALALGNAAALRRSDMHQCGNCGRYLYLVEAQEAVETVSKPKTPRKCSSKSGKIKIESPAS